MAKPTHTPARAVRVEDGLWQAAQQQAAERGETVSDVIRRALQRYVAHRAPRDSR
jgi:antitoxin component of RelBE/YafQ-DinJ toxin-antitoxin module